MGWPHSRSKETSASPLRLNLRGDGEGDVHLAAGFGLESVRNLLERLGHAGAAIDVKAFALKAGCSGLLRLLGLLLALVGGAPCQHAAGEHGTRGGRARPTPTARSSYQPSIAATRARAQTFPKCKKGNGRKPVPFPKPSVDR